MPAIRIDMAALYHLKVNRLAEALNAPETRQQATEIIRTLVENVIVGWSAEAKTHTIELVGELAALLALGTNTNAAVWAAGSSSLKLVAGAGFEPAAFRL